MGSFSYAFPYRNYILLETRHSMFFPGSAKPTPDSSKIQGRQTDWADSGTDWRGSFLGSSAFAHRTNCVGPSSGIASSPRHSNYLAHVLPPLSTSTPASIVLQRCRYRILTHTHSRLPRAPIPRSQSIRNLSCPSSGTTVETRDTSFRAWTTREKNPRRVAKHPAPCSHRLAHLSPFFVVSFTRQPGASHAVVILTDWHLALTIRHRAIPSASRAPCPPRREFQSPGSRASALL